MPVREIGKDAVEAALKEFRRRGRKAMLAKYGGGPSTHWYIEIGGSHFDQKLVIRAAHGHQGLGRLGDFNAGQAKSRLKRLGYRVVSKLSGRDGPVLVCRVAWMPGYQSNESAEAVARCQAAPHPWRGEVVGESRAAIPNAGPVARLTYNPRFGELLEQVDEFLVANSF